MMPSRPWIAVHRMLPWPDEFGEQERTEGRLLRRRFRRGSITREEAFAENERLAAVIFRRFDDQAAAHRRSYEILRRFVAENHGDPAEWSLLDTRDEWVDVAEAIYIQHDSYGPHILPELDVARVAHFKRVRQFYAEYGCPPDDLVLTPHDRVSLNTEGVHLVRAATVGVVARMLDRAVYSILDEA